MRLTLRNKGLSEKNLQYCRCAWEMPNMRCLGCAICCLHLITFQKVKVACIASEIESTCGHTWPWNSVVNTFSKGLWLSLVWAQPLTSQWKVILWFEKWRLPWLEKFSRHPNVTSTARIQTQGSTRHHHCWNSQNLVLS